MRIFSRQPFLHIIQIHLFQLSEDKSKLIEESEAYRGHMECLQLKVKDDFIIASDLMNSLTVLRHDGVQKKKLEQVNRGERLHQ